MAIGIFLLIVLIACTNGLLYLILEELQRARREPRKAILMGPKTPAANIAATENSEMTGWGGEYLVPSEFSRASREENLKRAREEERKNAARNS